MKFPCIYCTARSRRPRPLRTTLLKHKRAADTLLFGLLPMLVGPLPRAVRPLSRAVGPVASWPLRSVTWFLRSIIRPLRSVAWLLREWLLWAHGRFSFLIRIIYRLYKYKSQFSVNGAKSQEKNVRAVRRAAALSELCNIIWQREASLCMAPFWCIIRKVEA